MIAKDIYLDTNLWNALCDQSIDPPALVQRLAAKNACLAPGVHTFYELAKNFRGRNEQSDARGKVLFTHFKEFLLAETHPVKNNEELLAREMWSAQFRVPVFDILLTKADRSLLYEQAKKLANGEVSLLSRDFLETMSAYAKRTRSNQIDHLGAHPGMVQHLKSIPPGRLERWLEFESSGKAGIQILAKHILGRFPRKPAVQALEYATALLFPPAKRFARGVVKSDLYYNWRCANRGSVPRDLIDDMYHVLNAVYCDVYATGEAGQTEYAHLILTRKTRVAVYSGGMPIDQWIESLV
jgi:hypothetical protein